MPTTHTTLHCLSPLGCDTLDVESLTSYFCRLSTSHSTSSRDMAAWILKNAGQPVPDDFRWFRRSFSGCSPETAEWASRLSSLTGVSHILSGLLSFLGHPSFPDHAYAQPRTGGVLRALRKTTRAAPHPIYACFGMFPLRLPAPTTKYNLFTRALIVKSTKSDIGLHLSYLDIALPVAVF